MFAKPAKQMILSLAHLGRKDPILQKLLNHTLAWGDIPEEPVVLDEGELERRAFVDRFKNQSRLTQKKRAIHFEDEVEPYYVYEAIADAPIARIMDAPVAVAPVAVAPSVPVVSIPEVALEPVEEPFQVVKSSKSKKVLAKQEQAKQEQAKQEQEQEQEAQNHFPSVPNPQQIHTVIARNLYREIQMEELYQGFGVYGTIKDIYMPKNMDQNSPYFGTFKGFALIKYSNPLESARAVAAGPLYYQHKTITIEFAKADR